MTVILGGAYQGKLAFAKEQCKLSDSDIFYCTEQTEELPVQAHAVSGLHLFLLGKVHRGESCTQWAANALPELADKIILCDDISCGVVPLGADLRLWREETGRVLALFCKNAQYIYRLYCGVPTQLR